MQCNVGSADRLLRAVVGAGIIALGMIYGSWWGAVGIVPLITAVIKWCPAYTPFGFSTCKPEK